jgi:hypothetical protein
MFAMQYRIPLPADYDMGIIRERVAVNGAALDAYPGLGMKAYLLRERAVDGSPVNEYAPFYLWTDAAAAASFLFGGDGFGGIVRDFGRPVVETWVGVGHVPGPATDAVPTHAIRSTESLPADIDPGSVAASVIAASERTPMPAGLHSVTTAIDPRTWQLITLRLFAEPPPALLGEIYQVLHLAAPERDALPRSVASRQ